MSKEYGIAKGKKLKAYGYHKGSTQYGNWQFFNFTEKVKDPTGTYVPAQKYQIWCANQKELDLENGQEVEIGDISKVTFHWNEWNNTKERICDVTCEINVLNQKFGSDKRIAGTNFVPQDNPFADEKVEEVLQSKEDNPFTNIAVDDDMPF